MHVLFSKFFSYQAISSHICTETQLLFLNMAKLNVAFYGKKQLIEMISDACHDVTVSTL